MNRRPPTADQAIVAAATVIHDVAFGLRRHDPGTVTDAHHTLARRRRHVTGPLGDAFDNYLAEDASRHGPHHLRRAIRGLAHNLGIPDPTIAHIAEQPTLFGPATDPHRR